MNEETLTLYYYNDGLDEAERRTVAAELATDAALARAYAELCAELDQLRLFDNAAAPVNLASRLHSAIDREAQRSGYIEGRRFETRHEERVQAGPRGWLWGGALAATLLIGVLIGDNFQQQSAPLPEDPVTLPGPDYRSAAALCRGLLVHLRDSRRELESIAPIADSQRVNLTLQLVQRNRLFQRAAEQADANELARVLRAFEPLLLRLAEEDLGPAEVARLQSQLEFEMQVVLTKWSRTASDKAGTINT